MIRLRGLPLIALLAAACGALDDPARVAFHQRLAAPERLSYPELSRLITESVTALEGKPVRVKEAGGTRTLDSQGRAQVLAVLAGEIPVEDMGIRQDGAVTLRGIGGPGTPRHSELDAAQTLWIDIDTMLPHRFELVFSMPGFGDVVYDLVVNP